MENPNNFNQLLCFAIKDLKADCYHTPIWAKNVVDVLRNASIEANNPQSQLNRFPEDFAIHSIAKMDMTTGIVYPNLPYPQLISQISDLIKPKNSTKNSSI